MKSLAMKTVWMNGKLYPVSDVLFQMEEVGRWSIRSLDERLNLTVTTGWRRFENLNLRLSWAVSLVSGKPRLAVRFTGRSRGCIAE